MLLLLLGGVVVAPAQGAPAPVAREYVTLSGAAGRSVLVTFDRRVDFTAGGARSEFYQPHVTTTGQGILGYAILPAGNGTNAANLLGLTVPKADGMRTVIWPVGAKDGLSYPSGTYRLALVGTGKGTVRFRLPGLRPGSTSLAPRVPAGLQVGRHEAAAGTMSPYYIASETRDLARRTSVFTYTWYAGPATAATRVSGCYYRDEPLAKEAPGCIGGDSLALADLNQRTDYESWSVGTGTLDPGTWTVATEVDSVGAIDDAGAVFVWIDR